MKNHLTEKEFLGYLDKRIMDAVKSYSKEVGMDKALDSYRNIVNFCDRHNLSNNFVLLKMEDLLNESKSIKQ